MSLAIVCARRRPLPDLANGVQPWAGCTHANIRARRFVVKVRFPKAASSAVGTGPRAKRVEEAGPTDFISKEVDPILEKISAQGIHSLTERERRILEAARSKMEKR